MDQSLQGPTGGAPVDWRGLCGELLVTLESEGHAHWPGGPDGDPLIERARAALSLAQPEPEAEGPTDEELGLIYHDCCGGCEFMDQVGFEDAARAVLSRWGNHSPGAMKMVSPALAAKPVGEVPTDEELDDCADEPLERLASPACLALKPSPELTEAFEDLPPGRIELLPEGAQVIEPTKHTILVPARTPMPVAERLPGPGDCDEKGSCWLWSADDVDGVGHWSYSHRDWAQEGDVTHWLPATALPLPSGEVK